jgi:polysaccharide export outer membrane protein
MRVSKVAGLLARMAPQLLLLLTSIGLSQRVAAAQSFSDRSPEYVLHSGDVLDIRYRYTPEFDQVVTVRPDDRVTLVNLSTIQTGGMTVSQFHDRVVQLSSERLVNPEVTVLLKEFEKPHVYVEGEVTTPGRVELHHDMTVLDAIALAGGFKTTSSKSKVLIAHRTNADGPVVTTALDLNKLIETKALGEVVAVHSGDVIYVTQNGLSKLERITHLGQFGAIYNPIH